MTSFLLLLMRGSPVCLFLPTYPALSCPALSSRPSLRPRGPRKQATQRGRDDDGWDAAVIRCDATTHQACGRVAYERE